jgi:hypothetical protein
MSKKRDRKRPPTTAKAIVLRLVGDGSSDAYPHSPGTTTCSLCGVRFPQDMTQDGFGNFTTLTLNAPERHEPDCAWRMAFEYVNAHPKARKRLQRVSLRA